LNGTETLWVECRVAGQIDLDAEEVWRRVHEAKDAKQPTKLVVKHVA
jgi:hypothetical protein